MSNFIHKIIVTPSRVVNNLQAAIKWHQDHFITLRSISLMPRLFDKFLSFMQKEYAREGKFITEEYGELIVRDRDGKILEKNFRFKLYDCDIVRGSNLQRGDFYFERYKEWEGQEMNDIYYGADHKQVR